MALVLVGPLQEQTCLHTLHWSATVVEQYESTLDIYTVVTLVTTVIVVTVVTVVTLNRYKQVCKTLQQFVSAIGIN